MKASRALPLVAVLVVLLEALAVLGLTPACPHTIRAPAEAGPRRDAPAILGLRV